MKRLFCLLILATAPIFAQSLGPDYNLGRITGGPEGLHELSADNSHDLRSVGDISDFRFGKADIYQIDILGAIYGISNPSQSQFGIAPTQITTNIAAADGNRVNVSLASNTLAYYNTDGSSKMGFKAPFIANLYAEFSEQYLTKNGHIDVRPDQFGIAFLRGPILERGEYSHSLYATLDQKDVTDYNTKYWNFGYSPRFGLAKCLQIGGAYKVTLNNTDLTNREASANLEFRLSHFWLAGTVVSTNNNMGDIWNAHKASANFDAGLLLGHRGLSFTDVRGNWDHFFNPFLGFGQTLITSKGSLPLASENHSLNNASSIQAGLLPFATVGVTGAYAQPSHSDSASSFATSVQINLTNIHPRADGPRDVDALEYRWGYLPRPGEFEIQFSAPLPFNKGPVPSITSNSAFILSNELFQSFAGIQAFASPIQPNIAYPNGTTIDESSLTQIWRVQGRIGLVGRSFVDLEYAYVQGHLYETTPETNVHSAQAVCAKLGIATKPAIIEAGLFVVDGNQTIDSTTQASYSHLGPFFVRAIHKF